jgi:hypothetical protein
LTRPRLQAVRRPESCRARHRPVSHLSQPAATSLPEARGSTRRAGGESSTSFGSQRSDATRIVGINSRPRRESLAHEALVEERLQRVGVGVDDLLRGLEAAAPGEDGEASEEALLLVAEQVVRPFDRRSQGLLAGIGVELALEQFEALREALEQLLRAEDCCARSGKLERERKLVEAEAKLRNCLARGERGIAARVRVKSASPSLSASVGTG